LELTPNRTEVLSHDFVVVKSVIVNKSDLAVSIEHKAAGPTIQFEIRSGSDCIPIRGMDDRKSHAVRLSDPPLLDIDASYAEYDVILFDDKDQFVFNRPGPVELRAVVQLSGNRVESKPIVITVKRRAPSLIKQIEGVGISVATLGGQWLTSPLPDKVVALEDVGGTISDGIRNRQLIDRIARGEEKTGDDVVKYVRNRMAPLDAEIGLALLGNHYLLKQDWERLAKVNEAFSENSWMKASWEASLEFHSRRPPTIIVLPEEAQKK
jgi:hypothetical protein